MIIPILYLIDYFIVFSGTERHLFEMLQRLDRNKFLPYVAAFQASDYLVHKLEATGVPIKVLNMSRIYGLRQARVFKELSRFIKQHDIKIVQTFHTKPDLFGTALARANNVPVIISSRRDMAFDRTDRELLLYKALNRYVDAVICVSQQVKELVRREEGLDDRKLTIIYNGVETEHYRRRIDARVERRKLGIGLRQPVVGVLANFNAIKGHGFFLEACPAIRRRVPGVRFLLAGEGPEEMAMRRRAQELGLGDSAQFLGYRTDTPELLAAMDVVVAPSLSEGFSNTLIEALYMKKPVITTRVGGNSEIITDGETGILVDPADAGAIADAVVRVIGNPRSAARMGENGRKRVEENFLIDTMMARTQELYQRLLSEKVPETGVV